LCNFAHYRRYCRLHPRATMLRKRSVQGARVWDQAEHLWLVLTAHVMTANPQRPITYGEVANRLRYPTIGATRTLSRPLGLIGHACLLAQLPPLNIIVVSNQTGAPGAEAILRPNSTIEADQAAIFSIDWFSWRAPVAGSFRALWESYKDGESGFAGATISAEEVENNLR